MINVVQEENIRLKQKLATLRQTILRIDPSVMVDGRFEKMIVAPITVIDVACELIEAIPERKGEISKASELLS